MGCVVCRPCLPPSIPSVVQTRVTCRCSDWERCGTVWLVPRPHSSSPPHSELTQPSNHLECPSRKEGVPEQSWVATAPGGSASWGLSFSI